MKQQSQASHQEQAGCSRCEYRGHCLPEYLDAECLADIETLVDAPRRLRAGVTLYRQGGVFRRIYIVRSGSFKSWRSSAGGDSQVLGFHLPGEILGLDGLDRNRFRSSAQALESASVCSIAYDRLRDQAARVPGLYLQIMRVISREIFRDHEHTEMMGRRQAAERLAFFVHRLSARYRRLGWGDRELVLTMSRADLASYLGLVVETVSRWFSRMHEQGVLDVHRRNIRILDHDFLAGQAGMGSRG